MKQGPGHSGDDHLQIICARSLDASTSAQELICSADHSVRKWLNGRSPDAAGTYEVTRRNTDYISMATNEPENSEAEPKPPTTKATSQESPHQTPNCQPSHHNNLVRQKTTKSTIEATLRLSTRRTSHHAANSSSAQPSKSQTGFSQIVHRERLSKP